jgi:glycosyltransferase involved in cell wall biosynthesis
MVAEYGSGDHGKDGRRRDQRQGSVLTPPRIAITYDWLTSFGGAERVLHELHGLFPSAPIFTSVHTPEALPPETRGWDVRPSVLQHLPFARRYSRALLPLMPFAFSQFDLADYDVVITVSSAFSKGVRSGTGGVNLCYCLTPPRYLWTPDADARLSTLGALAEPGLAVLRAMDLRAAAKVDRFIAISATVRDRIRRTYGRDADVIFPPVDTDRIQPSGGHPDDFYLVVSRLVRQKRIDVAVDACTLLGRPLMVVGSGPELPRLRRAAGTTVRFLGHLPDAEVFALYARCRAFLFPGFEDFGLTPVEAQAAGRPVVAFRRGGAAETVTDGETGVLFDEQTPHALAAAMVRLDGLSLDPADCRRNALRFSADVFRTAMAGAVASVA